MTTVDEKEVAGQPVAIYATLPGRTDEIKLAWTKEGCGTFIVGEVLFGVPFIEPGEENGRLRFFRPESPIPPEYWGVISASIREEGFKGMPLEVVFNSEGTIQFTVVGRPDIDITLTYDDTGLKGTVVGDPH